MTGNPNGKRNITAVEKLCDKAGCPNYVRRNIEQDIE